MSQLVDVANKFISACLASSTRLTYQSALNSYLKCYASFGLEAPIPATQVSLVLWLSHSATRPRPLVPSTLRSYLSALASLHEELGFRNLLDDKPLVNRCYKGIKRITGVGKMVRNPITTDVLAKIKVVLDGNFYSRLYFAAASLATYGLLRMGEFTVHGAASKDTDAFKVLTLAQLQLLTEGATVISTSDFASFSQVTNMSLTLRTSKTDPFRKTVTIRIGHPVPVQAMLSYLRIHPSIHISSSSLFVQSISDHSPLTREVMIAVTRALLKLAGFNEKEYHGHSFRKGGATSLFNAGVAESVIQLVGRWTSDCYKLYIVTPVETLLNASRAM
jgi:hypothetical protein